MMEKPLQSRMDEHPTMQTVMALLGASTILTYMGAFQPRPLIPKACNLITTLPSTVHNMLAKKRPICSSKKSDRDRFHTEIRGWVVGGKGRRRFSCGAGMNREERGGRGVPTRTPRPTSAIVPIPTLEPFLGDRERGEQRARRNDAEESETEEGGDEENETEEP